MARVLYYLGKEFVPLKRSDELKVYESYYNKYRLELFVRENVEKMIIRKGSETVLIALCYCVVKECQSFFSEVLSGVDKYKREGVIVVTDCGEMIKKQDLS